MVIATSVGSKTWFGTRDYSQWIETPLSGANVSAESSSAGGTLLNGGGWQKDSNGSHKTYNFSWRKSSTRQELQIMKNYRDGTWGDGLIHFVLPTTYDTNILPAAHADPSLATRGGPSLARGATITASRDSTLLDTPYDFRLQNYPLMWTKYSFPTGTPAAPKRLFVPIPEGFSLHLGAVWQGTSNTALRVRRVKQDGTFGRTFTVTSIPAWIDKVTTTDLIGNGDAGVELWLEKTGTAVGTFEIKAMTARLQPAFKSPDAISVGPWVGGQGNSGCRFDGAVNEVLHTGLNGGQVEYGANFREVGSWEQ